MPTFTPARRVLLLGATGTIGRATCGALLRRGHDVVCFVRPHAASGSLTAARDTAQLLAGSTIRFGDVREPKSLAQNGFQGEHFDCVVSCIASRSGTPADAWAIDHQANLNALAAAKKAGVSHLILLSAICVQKPRLAFQHAKLAFETALIDSGMKYSIVRPTAFFKSLSGQIERIKRGKPFLVFGDGTLTACKPISDKDIADYIAECLDDENRWNRILPIGGPGPAITPRQQGEKLFALLGRPPHFRQVPLAVLDLIISVLSSLSKIVPPLGKKAELARIGRYYATESMLLLDPATGRYDAEATPATGVETLFDFYTQLAEGAATPERGDHAIF